MNNLRIIDANINRLREGLRTIEDILRFEFNFADFIKTAKALRHKLSLIDSKTYNNILLYRDSLNDCGFDNSTQQEKERKSLSDILKANFLRCEESSRVLEEMFKLINKNNYSDIFKKIRYELYNFEKVVFERINKFHYLTGNYLIINTTNKIKNLEEILEIYKKYNITTIQINNLHLENKELYNLALQLKEILQANNINFIINKEIDLCIAIDSDGIIFESIENSFLINIARKLFDKKKIIGFLAKTIDEITHINNLSIDFIVFENKNNDLKLIKEILSLSNYPVIVLCEEKNYDFLISNDIKNIAISI